MQRIERFLAALMTLALLCGPTAPMAGADPPENEVETLDNEGETAPDVDDAPDDAFEEIGGAEADSGVEVDGPDHEGDAGEDLDGSDSQEDSDRSDADDSDADGVDDDADDDGAPVLSQAPLEYDGEGYAVAASEVLALASVDADRDIFQALGYTVRTREELPGLGLSLLSISVPSDSSAEAVLAELASRKSDSIYALNHIFAAGRMAEGVAPATRAQSAPDPNATVGIIDGAVAAAALPAHVTLETASFADAGSTTTDDHASAVAALLADIGVSRVYAANIFNDRNASAAAMIRALDWMAGRKVPVINISLAGPPNAIVHEVIKIMHRRGHLLVAAVGNAGPAAPPLYPGAYPEVVAVTAVDNTGNIYRRANRGPQTLLAADGVNVAAVDAHGAPRTVSGTSFAAPVVSALLARSVNTLDADAGLRALGELIDRARDLGSPGRDPIYGHGWVGHGK